MTQRETIIRQAIRYAIDWVEDDTHDGNFSTVYAALSGPDAMVAVFRDYNIIDDFLEEEIQEQTPASEVRAIRQAIFARIAHEFPRFREAVKRAVKELR